MTETIVLVFADRSMETVQAQAEHIHIAPGTERRFYRVMTVLPKQDPGDEGWPTQMQQFWENSPWEVGIFYEGLDPDEPAIFQGGPYDGKMIEHIGSVMRNGSMQSSLIAQHLIPIQGEHTTKGPNE